MVPVPGPSHSQSMNTDSHSQDNRDSPNLQSLNSEGRVVQPRMCALPVA